MSPFSAMPAIATAAAPSTELEQACQAQIQVDDPVVCGIEDGLSVVPSLGGTVWPTRDGDTSAPCHHQ